MFASYLSDKRLISRIYKELKIKHKRTNDTTNKWGNEFYRQFSKEAQMANKHMKKCSTSLVIKEMQIKITLRFHLLPVRMAISKKTNNNGRGYWGWGWLCIVGGNIKQCNHYGNQYEGKNLKTELSYDPAIPLPGTYLKECESAYNRDTYTLCLPQHYSP
jgi:hypothetical protein